MPLPFIDVAFGAVLGLGIGWWLGWRRSSAQAAAGETALAQELRHQLQQRDQLLDQARSELAELAGKAAQSSANHQATAALLAEQRIHHSQQLSIQRESQEKALADLRDTFKALSASALRETQPEFLRLAQETLARFHESAKGDLSQRQQSIASLIDPLQQQLYAYQLRLAQTESLQSSALGEVKKQLATLSEHSRDLFTETQQLRRVLGSNQARGRWGEVTLRRVVESAGMSAHCDFSEQIQAGDSKPDLLIRLPGNRLILVDAKVPELDFLEALDGADPARRRDIVKLQASKLRDTIKALSDKEYPRQFTESFDYVVLFLPAESLFSVALEGDQDLLVWAATRKILLATPASLIALLRSITLSWQQYAQVENAREIAGAAQELFVRIARFTEHLEQIRKGLEKANGAFNDAVGSYDRMIRPSGERLVRLGGTAPDRDLADLLPIPNTLRGPSSST